MTVKLDTLTFHTVQQILQTHIQNVLFITFQFKQWLHEHACMLHYTCIACLVKC